MSALIVLFEREPDTQAAERALRGAGFSVARAAQGRLSLHAEGIDAELQLVGAALGSAVLAEAAAHSDWPEACEAIDRHGAQALITPLPGDEVAPLHLLQSLTRVAAALLDLPGALALFDQAGGALSDAPVAARRLAATPATPPIDLWVGLRTFEVADARGWFLDTLGMAQLGLPDLEAYAGEGAATAEVSAWLRNVSLSMVQEEAGPRLRHGDTLDGPDEQPWMTTEDVATVEPARPVLRFVPVQRAGR